jgi:1,4-alpha-glucan branching enzyme
MEKRPMHNSKFFDIEGYPWHDERWMSKRTKNFDEPMNVYELHVGSFVHVDGEEFIDYERLAPILCKHLKEHNYTHVELMPILEHPVDESWGYQVSSFYSVTSRYGNPKQLMFLVDYLHQHGFGVIMDFVSVHFACDDYGLLDFDGEQVYGYDNDLRYSQWGSPSFDLGRNPTRSYLISSVSYFLEYFHFDGVRFDAVSNMVYYNGDSSRGENSAAIEFIKRMNSLINERYENVMLIAEDSTSFPKVCGDVRYDNSLGFDYKWDLGWMNDTLKYFELDPIYRKGNHNLITFSMHYFPSERFLLPLSHDEVVHGKKSLLDKMPGDAWQKFASLRTLYAYYMMHPGKKLLFMGSEFGQGLEWRYAYGLEWELLEREPHIKMKDFVNS